MSGEDEIPYDVKVEWWTIMACYGLAVAVVVGALVKWNWAS